MKKFCFAIASAILALLLFTTASADPVTGPGVPELSDLDEIMTTWMQTFGFHSATLAVSKDEKLVYEKGYGYMDQGRTIPMLPYARMRLATNSVALTKRALRQLIADGRLHSNDLVWQIVNLPPWQGTYVDSRMQQFTVEHLIDDQACLANSAKSVKQIGLEMGLGRNATLAESIQYQWSNPQSMRDPVLDPCTVGDPDSADFSHYAMELAAYIIAKTVNPAINNSDYLAVGTIMGDYINNKVGEPIGSVFLQAGNLASEAHQNEVWYDSDNYTEAPEWNRYWVPNQPSVPSAYSIDFYARPGSGTLVSSGRDILNYLNHFRWDTAETKPQSLVGWASGSYSTVGFGGLPGTTTVVAEQVNTITGESGAFVVLVNKHYTPPSPDAPDPAQEITNSISAYLSGNRQWPAIDLFDYVYACNETTASLADHKAAGRVEILTETNGCNTVDSYHAVGSGEDLGTDGTAIETLKEDPPGYFVRGTCPMPDTEKPQITLQGANPMDVALGSAYIEPGYTAYDNVDGDLSGQVVVSGTVDTNTLGTYYKGYDVTDTAGNAALTVTRTIHVVPVDPQCITATNATHLSAGRAYRSWSIISYIYYATGSGNSLGAYSGSTSSLQQTAPNYWIKVDSCN